MKNEHNEKSIEEQLNKISKFFLNVQENITRGIPENCFQVSIKEIEKNSKIKSMHQKIENMKKIISNRYINNFRKENYIKNNNFVKIKKDIEFFQNYSTNMRDKSICIEQDITQKKSHLKKKKVILKQLYGNSQ